MEIVLFNLISHLAGLLYLVFNKFLTFIENLVFKLDLSEYHTGLRAYSRKFLKTMDFESFSNDFVFDSEILAAAAAAMMIYGRYPFNREKGVFVV